MSELHQDMFAVVILTVNRMAVQTKQGMSTNLVNPKDSFVHPMTETASCRWHSAIEDGILGVDRQTSLGEKCPTIIFRTGVNI